MADLAKVIAEVKRFDSSVDEALVTAIFNSLRPVHGNKDAMLVSCGDDSELETVKKNFLMKKLGMDDSPELAAAVSDVCATMQGDRMKARITFYYLLTKKFGKESAYA
ncbi:MAG: DUF2853 family protein [Cocleimonas sp.]